MNFIPTDLRILRIAIPVPLNQYYNYFAPKALTQGLKPGMRIKVPFRKKHLIGIFVGWGEASDVATDKLKSIIEIIDTEPVISLDIFSLCVWAAAYYHYPIGEVLSQCLPTALRQGKPTLLPQKKRWLLNPDHPPFSLLNNTPPLKKIAEELQHHTHGLLSKELKNISATPAILKKLSEQKFIIQQELFSYNYAIPTHVSLNIHPLNDAQKKAVMAIQHRFQQFAVFLLDGITGSGKTEVYLHTMSEVIQRNQQVLILVPEIGLTPQTIHYFRQRFNVPVMALHSNLTDTERLSVWLLAKSNAVKIVIGTRSAIFTPFNQLGLIIIDEEHDLSFKQQDGFKYHARDLAIMRAHYNKIPIVLGSATPALDTFYKAKSGKFSYLSLPERAGLATLPNYQLIDIRNVSLYEGLSTQLIEHMKVHLANKKQVMLFLNRRGFAPILLCRGCGWVVPCPRCDTRMTYHQRDNKLHCHHCTSQKKIPSRCEHCHKNDLHPIGLGTERIENALQANFPLHRIIRIDRDSTQKKGSLETLLDCVHEGNADILIGTQMLAKGHHFPNVTLVGIIDVDGGFFSSDFRALEKMGQLILQVAGRAGRVQERGHVLIQTHYPDHPLLLQLIHRGYHSFAETLLKERAQAVLPPFSALALISAESHQPQAALIFLGKIKKLLEEYQAQLFILGPHAALRSRKAGFYRMQLLLQAKQRRDLQTILKTILPAIENFSNKRTVRWSLDVDPLDML